MSTDTTTLANEALNHEGVHAYFPVDGLEDGVDYNDYDLADELAAWLDNNRDKWTPAGADHGWTLDDPAAWDAHAAKVIESL